MSAVASIRQTSSAPITPSKGAIAIDLKRNNYNDLSPAPELPNADPGGPRHLSELHVHVVVIRLVLAATTVADEPVQAVQRAAVVGVGDEDLLALLDVAHSREGHDLPAAVPGVLGVPPRVARVIEVGRDGQDALVAIRELEAEVTGNSQY